MEKIKPGQGRIEKPAQKLRSIILHQLRMIIEETPVTKERTERRIRFVKKLTEGFTYYRQCHVKESYLFRVWKEVQ